MSPETKARRYMSGWCFATGGNAPYGVHWGDEDYEAGWAKGRSDRAAMIRSVESNYGVTIPVVKIQAGTIPK